MAVPTQPNIFDQSANSYNTAVGTAQDAVNPNAVPFTMNQFLNPYQDQVIGDTLSRIRDRQLQDLNMVRGQAAQSSAYGGARQGLVESELMSNYDRNSLEAAGILNQQGFNNAAQFGLSRIGQQLGGASTLGGLGQTGYNLGTGTTQQQLQSGQMMRGFNQGILDQATRQFDAYIGYPQTSLGTALAGIQGNPLAGNQTRTSTYNPGLLDYLSLGAGMGSSYLGGK